jgi:hypothetical protein
VDKKPLIKKCLAVGIILLFVGTCLIPAIAQDTEKSLPTSRDDWQYVDMNGPRDVNWTVNGTMGQNDFYISPITLTCTYDHEWIANIYYNYGYDWELYIEPFTIDEQGVIVLEWFSVDYEGNEESHHILPYFKIDYTPPEIVLTVEKISFNKWLFSADAEDSFSGVINVEFYLDNQFLSNVTIVPYEYVWTGSGNHIASAIAYDAAGLNASSTMNVSYSLCHSQSDLLHQQIIRVFHNLILYKQILVRQLRY